MSLFGSRRDLAYKSVAFVSKHLEFAKQGHDVTQFVTSQLQIVDLRTKAKLLYPKGVATQHRRSCKIVALAYKTFGFVSTPSLTKA